MSFYCQNWQFWGPSPSQLYSWDVQVPLDKVFCKSAGGRLIWITFGSGVLLVMKRLLCQKALLSQVGWWAWRFWKHFLLEEGHPLFPFSSSSLRFQLQLLRTVPRWSVGEGVEQIDESMDGNQGDLDVDLEDAKAEKNNISTKREGAIRCFFFY